MARDPGTIAAVKARLDIAEVVRRYVELRPAGGRLTGLCPFHQEKTPSFSVNPEQGFFYCFGCQASGDVFDFYARINGLEFREALEALAEQAGVALEGHAPDPREAQRKQLRKACLVMHELAQRWFRRCLADPVGKPARDYLARRAMSPAVVESFGLGYSPEGWQGLHDVLRDKGFAPAQGVEAGLLSKNERGRVYDRFRGRLIFPIQDLAGRVIAFGGRVIGDGEPKYLNSSDTPIYTKGEHLYGLHQARPVLARTRRALLTEGYVDVLALVQHGFAEAVGVLGTALTEAQVKRLAGLASEVVLVFDGDAAGRKAALRSAPMVLAQGLNCRVVLLPDGQDADDLLRAGGAQAFQALLDAAQEGLEFCMLALRKAAAPKDVLAWAKDFVRGLADPGLRAYFLPRLAAGLGLAEVELRGSMAGVAPKAAREPAGLPGATADKPGGAGRGAATAIAEPGHKRDRELLSFAIRHPAFRAELAALDFGAALSHGRAKALWDKMGRHGDAEIFTHLDEGERRFWAEAMLQPALDDAAAARWMDDLRAFLQGCRRREACEDIAQALREAKARGDQGEVLRLLKALQESRAGAEESGVPKG